DGFRAAEEQRLLVEHNTVVLQFPWYGYSVPGILKEWMDPASALRTCTAVAQLDDPRPDRLGRYVDGDRPRGVELRSWRDVVSWPRAATSSFVAHRMCHGRMTGLPARSGPHRGWRAAFQPWRLAFSQAS
ncbi:MAG: NAD(P)H-dependent oxidoreductase, partial [Aeromicrobium sp.]